ncbi:MAG TPA: 50S ribosomal protein L11 methyltransferase [Cyclobacteriaceae bacterium]|nr:50S ribosomal protein L11 methyltransferase [Cyclobacteriaceae bacterium]
MFYVRLKVVCDPDFREILMAEIAEAGFDTFMETDEGFEAYAEDSKEDTDQLNYISQKYSSVKPLLFLFDKIKKENWNEQWEKNVDPIIVDNRCLIRAEFHKIPEKYPYEIVITPKMSFGTGHHQTTYLMIKAQLDLDHKNKTVMDAGCGTAILSVMASMRGAKHVEAFDIDAWSIENGEENARRNGCGNIRIRQGTVRDFSWPEKFDIILANINKNVLLDEIPVYSKLLCPGGELLLSGFYTSDVAELEQLAIHCGLTEKRRNEKDTWASLLLVKNG